MAIDSLPDDVETLKAMLLAALTESAAARAESVAAQAKARNAEAEAHDHTYEVHYRGSFIKPVG